jgi:hypothetical protein
MSFSLFIGRGVACATAPLLIVVEPPPAAASPETVAQVPLVVNSDNMERELHACRSFGRISWRFQSNSVVFSCASGHERPFRNFNSPPKVIGLAVVMYLQYPLSLRDVADPRRPEVAADRRPKVRFVVI